MGKAMQKVTLEAAFQWTCPSCKMENFSRTVIAELNAEELEDFTKAMGTRPQPGDVRVAPEEVRCEYCACEFETND